MTKMMEEQPIVTTHVKRQFEMKKSQQAEMMKSRLEIEERERQQIKEKARLQAEAEVVEDAQRKATALETKHRREHEKATTRKTFGADDTMRHKSSVVRSLFMPEKDKKGSTYEFKEQHQNKASSSNHKSTMKKEFRRLSKAAENQVMPNILDSMHAGENGVKKTKCANC